MQNFGGTTTSTMVFLKKRPIITLKEALKLPQKCHYQRIVARIPRSVFKQKK